MTEAPHYQLSDFDYDLPEELIAQTPLKDRSSSRLLVLNAVTGAYEDKHFYDIIDYLNPGDALVMNTHVSYQPVCTVFVQQLVAMPKCFCYARTTTTFGKSW